jgi:tRNA 2-selenouridine synthase
MNAPLPPGPPPRPEARVQADALGKFAERLDVRSPSEFAEDHIPGAINLPVLDDAERAYVGTTYVQVSAFDARKIGAPIVARNIGRIVETYARDKPREWTPLVYCWRGGQRSRALTHVLCEIGWRAYQLDGGYRAYRRHVVASLGALPHTLSFRLVCGLTGAGKSRLLDALADEGAQVLDLERIACHRGSLLGDWPGDAQPSQKWFESQVHDTLAAFDPQRVVYVESESRKIGDAQIPEALLAAMRASPCVRVETPHSLRLALLKGEYTHFLGNPEAIANRLERLVPIVGKKTVARWIDAAARADHDTLIAELLAAHYDPLYARSIEHNFPHYPDAFVAAVHDISLGGFQALARNVIAGVAPVQHADCVKELG